MLLAIIIHALTWPQPPLLHMSKNSSLIPYRQRRLLKEQAVGKTVALNQMCRCLKEDSLQKAVLFVSRERQNHELRDHAQSPSVTEIRQAGRPKTRPKRTRAPAHRPEGR